MVNEIVNGGITDKYWALSNTLVYMSYLVSGRELKPWAVASLALFVLIPCIQTSSNNMAALWLCLPYLLEYAMEVFTCNKPWLRWSTGVQDSFRNFSGDPAPDSILQDLRELVRISVLLLSPGSPFLRVWLGPKFPEPSLPQLSCLVPFLCVPLCLVPTALIYVQCLGRSVEFTYDQEAQDTVKILGGLQWLKSLRMGPGIQNVVLSRQVYFELVVLALFITMPITMYLL
jgi:hypothetical protein